MTGRGPVPSPTILRHWSRPLRCMKKSAPVPEDTCMWLPRSPGTEALFTIETDYAAHAARSRSVRPLHTHRVRYSGSRCQAWEILAQGHAKSAGPELTAHAECRILIAVEAVVRCYEYGTCVGTASDDNG
jgi:hypothetical protein